MLFKTFEAKVKKVVGITRPVKDLTDINLKVTFSRSKILLKEDQIERMYLDPYLVNCFTHQMNYEFDKIYNEEDKKEFSITVHPKPNETEIFNLDISAWNKFKANIIHHRYWVDREKEWFAKTIIATVIGALFGIMGAWLGYKIGYQNGKTIQESGKQDTTQLKKQ